MLLEQVGLIKAPYGIKGEVSLVSYVSNPLSLKKYSPLINGKKYYNISNVRQSNKKVIVKIHGIESRNEAENLVGTVLYAQRSRFPRLGKNEFFASELIGVKVLLPDSTEYGEITECYDFGAGPIIEVKLENNSDELLLPFNTEYFPEVNRNERTVTLILPKIV